jgi:ABC-2 type transport system permease protein
MKVILAIARREVDEYFATPLGWICLFCFVGITGLFFADSVELLPELHYATAMSNPYAPNLDIFNTLFIPSYFQRSTLFLIFICPAICMRLFSADYREGSFELLLSSPISSLQIVLGKYLGAIGFLCVLLAGTMPQVVVLVWMGNADPGVLAGGILALILVGASYVAVGMLTSAFTEEQILAGVMAFGVLISMLVLEEWAPGDGGQVVSELQTGELVLQWVKQVVSGAAILGHISDLIRGVLRLSDMVFFLSFIALAIGVTTWRVESRRWS